jgi:hypothetical protein
MPPSAHGAIEREQQRTSHVLKFLSMTASSRGVSDVTTNDTGAGDRPFAPYEKRICPLRLARSLSPISSSKLQSITTVGPDTCAASSNARRCALASRLFPKATPAGGAGRLARISRSNASASSFLPAARNSSMRRVSSSLRAFLRSLAAVFWNLYFSTSMACLRSFLRFFFCA